MKKTIIILSIILSPLFIGAQNYFFNFVDGWINNSCVEYEDDYLLLGNGTTGNWGEHIHLFNKLNDEGELLNQFSTQNDTIHSMGSRWNTQVAHNFNDNSLLTAGYIVSQENQVYGSLIRFEFESGEFSLLKAFENIVLDNILALNDSTLIIAGDRNYPGSGSLNSSLYNMDMEGNIRWQTNFSCGYLCQRWPVQILPLSNGNIAFLMSEYDGDFPWDSRRERAVMVVLDSQGEVLWEEYPGDEEAFRIWAGGMVEVDGEIMVSYTQRFFYNNNGEWIHNDENTFFLEKYTIDDGELSWSHNFYDNIRYGLDENIPGAGHRIRQMQMLEDGNILLSGTSGIMGLAAKINTEGELIWYQPYAPHLPLWMTEGNATEFTEIYSMTPISDGGFMMAGQYDSSPSSLYPGGIQTAIAVKVDEYGCLEEDCQVGIEEYEENVLSVYPNPSTGRFVIELPAYIVPIAIGIAHYDRLSEKNLSVINALGVEISGRYHVSVDKIEIDISAFADGVYFVRLNTENRIFTSKIIKQ